MTKTSWILLATLALSYVCDAYKILVVFPLAGKSHSILGDGHVRHLLDAGHEVTYITPFPKEKPHPRLTQVDVSSLKKLMPENILDIKALMNNEIDMRDQSLILFMFSFMAQSTLQDENVQRMLNDPKQHFDAVIVEWMFSEIYSGFATVYNCPLIWFSSVDPHWMILRLIDEIPNPAYTPDIQSNNAPPLSFFQRVKELYILIKGLVLHDFIIAKQEDEAYQKSYGPAVAKKGRSLPPYEEVKYNGSLVLGNSHVSLGEALRLPQNYKPIGGYHIDSNLKPLPEDLKKLMDNAKNGVIYFSMGSNLKSKDLPDELKKSLLKMFGTLKQTVLWKFEEVLPGLPSNVHILQWAPQPSVLAHPNCILFITHGGLLSTTETVHYGVPIIGIPVFADQFINVDRSVARGYAKRVDLSYTMADELKAAIEEVISNPVYKNKVKDLSLIYHDRPVLPGKELVHWVEHVVRTRGAPHLRSPALHVPFYQKLYLDLAAVVSVLLITLYVITKRILKKIFGRTNQKKINEKKRN